MVSQCPYLQSFNSEVPTDGIQKSTPNLHTMYDDRVYSLSGPHLSAPGRDRLGWLPMDRVFTARGADPLNLTITSLSFNSATTSGYLMARVPIKTRVGEPRAYYTIECRNSFTDFDEGLNALGLDANGVVIHRVNETDQANWLLYPRFATSGSSGKPFSWCEWFRSPFAFVNHRLIWLNRQSIEVAIHLLTRLEG